MLPLIWGSSFDCDCSFVICFFQYTSAILFSCAAVRMLKSNVTGDFLVLVSTLFVKH